MKYDFNYHTHTYRCNHAVGSDQQYVQAAIDAGFKTLGFSDHAPIYGIENHNRMSFKGYDEYKYSIEKLKEQFKDKIDIKLGIEAEWYLNDNPAMECFFNDLDYVILSIHGSNLQDQFKYAHLKTSDDILEYGKYCCEAMGKRKWLYLAHPDYYMRRENDFSQQCEEVAHMIGQRAQETNTILEINITGIIGEKKLPFKQGDFYFYPHKMFWQIISQYDVKCIFGLDAHHPQVLTDSQHYIDLALEELKDIKLNIIKTPII